MKHIVLFSGGVQSSYVAALIAKEYPKDVILLFHDTLTEPVDNDRFRKEVADYIGLPITKQSDGRDIWQLFDDKGFLGNNRVSICSYKLKVEQGLKFYKQLDEPFIIYYGFSNNEYKRAQKVTARNPNLNCKFPLLERRIHKDTCIRTIVHEWNICLPEMYTHLHHANCLPCVRGGKAYWTKIYRHYIDAYNRAVEAEEYYGYTIMPNISLTEFAETIGDDIQEEFDNTLPCICSV